jgi:hypothetical protein
MSRKSPYALRSHISYTIEASNARDIQNAVAFANEYNIRLVTYNTSYDYNGKSTGARDSEFGRIK